MWLRTEFNGGSVIAVTKPSGFKRRRNACLSSGYELIINSAPLSSSVVTPQRYYMRRIHLTDMHQSSLLSAHEQQPSLLRDNTGHAIGSLTSNVSVCTALDRTIRPTGC
jgi:hypothetical protein